MAETHPASWFASPPGEDGTIISREDIRRWLRLQATSSEWMRFTTFGTSTEGRPLDAIFIGDGLADHAFVKLADERAEFAATALSTGPPASDAKPIILITSGIHATELGGPQSIPELVHWLVTSEEPDAKAIRERVLVIVVPTLNPDGMDLVKRSHDRTAGTDQQGSQPPLLYHRFAGHDNNRDWVFRNLVETRQVMDRIHKRWLPHVTLDQHQMNKHGPRFVVPPYADPWEPHVHPSIIAMSSSLGHMIAADMTTSGKAGVLTGRYFDAWEPSRALQHYRGGVRILAEAANANMAYPTDVTAEQLASSPLPLDLTPSTSMPLPWQPGTWRLRDIMDYHIAAAKSLLRHVSRTADRWAKIQYDALTFSPGRDRTFHIPYDSPVGDPAANRRLASILSGTGVVIETRRSATTVDVNLGQPMGPLVGALLKPTVFPERHGSTSYDITSHHLPLLLGATVRSHNGKRPRKLATEARPTQCAFLAIDARNHTAPNIIEEALAAPRPSVWRAMSREMVSGALVEPGTWIVDSSAVSDATRFELADAGHLRELPKSARPMGRRDVVAVNISDSPAADYGWMRLWLHDRAIPYLDTDAGSLPSLAIPSERTTYLLADAPRAQISGEVPDLVRNMLAEGATVIAFGATGRYLAEQVSPYIGCHEVSANDHIKAPGALLRLVPDRSTALGLGLDSSLPAMFQRDGTFVIADGARDVTTLARFASSDTLVSGWMSDTRFVQGKPAVVQVRHGAGTLYAFAFRPLFRGQMLVTSPLVHNLLYTEQE